MSVETNQLKATHCSRGGGSTKQTTTLARISGRFKSGASMDNLQGPTWPKFSFEAAAVGPETLEIAAASGIQDR